MRTSDAVTGAGVIPVSYAGLWALYVAVGAATVWILRRLARMPVETPAPPAPPEVIAWRRRPSHSSLSSSD